MVVSPPPQSKRGDAYKQARKVFEVEVPSLVKQVELLNPGEELAILLQG